jgi:hypothetical protein
VIAWDACKTGHVPPDSGLSGYTRAAEKLLLSSRDTVGGEGRGEGMPAGAGPPV